MNQKTPSRVFFGVSNLGEFTLVFYKKRLPFSVCTSYRSLFDVCGHDISFYNKEVSLLRLAQKKVFLYNPATDVYIPYIVFTSAETQPETRIKSPVC